MSDKRGIVRKITVDEFLKLLRSYGISCSYYSVREAIIEKVFPFATAINGRSENTEFWIFEKDAIDWLEARVTE